MRKFALVGLLMLCLGALGCSNEKPQGTKHTLPQGTQPTRAS